MRILTALLFLLGAGSLFCAYLITLGAGLCESDCSRASPWNAILVALAVALWGGAVGAFRRRLP